MFKIFFLLIMVWIAVSASSVIYAQERRLTFDQLESGVLSIQNPFESQLPKKEEKPADAVKPPVKPGPVRKPPEKPKPPPPESPPVLPPKTPPKIQEVKKADMPHFTVTGVIWKTERPQAIVNGQIVEIGDTIEEIEIKDIRRSGIDVLLNGETITVNYKGASHEE